MPRNPAKIDIVSLGDSALIVHFCDNAAALKAQSQIEAANIFGLTDCAAAYRSVGVFYDPAVVGTFDDVAAKICAALKKRAAGAREESRRIEIPASFDGEFALDLEDVARHAQLSPNEVVDLYCSVEYRVACVGFTPGFPYLIGLPPRLATPRRATPRKVVPAGSIAIGGDQAGIYPIASPGGWNVIGRTSLRLFDPHQDPPATLRAGDRVRFVRSTS